MTMAYGVIVTAVDEQTRCCVLIDKVVSNIGVE